MAIETYVGFPPPPIREWIEEHQVLPNDKLRLVVETTSSYKKSGIYSAERDDTSKPIVIDWGDGTVEQVNGDVSQKVHEYATVGTFNVVVENIKSYAASTSNSTWYYNTSQNKYTLKDVIAMPDSVTSIGDRAFFHCSGLTSVMIPDNVTSIGDDAFSNSGLTSVMIPDNVTSIGDDAFYQCNNLQNVIIGNNVSNIGTHAFDLGSNLNSITINNRLENITGEIGCFVRLANNANVIVKNTTAEVQQLQATLANWFSITASMDSTIIFVCTDGSLQIYFSCIIKGTDILLADGTTKKIEDLTYNDVLKVWDFDEGQLGFAKVCWLTRPGLKSNHYYQLTFNDGTVLKTTGINSNHRIFSVDQSRFTNVCDAKVGDRVFSINGTLTITDVQYVEEECEYYNVMTAGKINCFANGILTSDRYGNLYPIQNMTYVKDGREIRPYSVYEALGVDRYWYDNLRLGENTETPEKSREYVWKCLGQMLPLPE